MQGNKFGRWTVVGTVVVKGTNRYWPCRCECGKEVLVGQANLTRGVSLSCGCLRREMRTTHGKNRDRVYCIWQNMKKRCDPSCGEPRYVSRGITVCERWRSFENFLADMGEPLPNQSIDRIDNNGNYEPGNCRWATAKEQARNTSRNVDIEFRGETLCLLDWALRIGINQVALRKRIRKWGLERALTTPKQA